MENSTRTSRMVRICADDIKKESVGICPIRVIGVLLCGLLISACVPATATPAPTQTPPASPTATSTITGTPTARRVEIESRKKRTQIPKGDAVTQILRISADCPKIKKDP